MSYSSSRSSATIASRRLTRNQRLIRPPNFSAFRHFSVSYNLRPPMKLGIINSAFYQAGVNTATGLKHIARIGFDCVDVHTEAIGISPKEVSLVAKTCEKLDLPIISLPVCSLGLADFASPVRKFHVERTKKFVDLARTWNAKNVLLVLGEYMWQREVIPPQAQWNWALETCREIGDY